MRKLDQDERTVIGVLDREECLTLLRWESVGRLAVARSGEAPIVVPVNFVLDGGTATILFRTDAGDTTERLLENRASFQVDRFDWYRRIGWSVLVQGTAHLLTPEEEAAALGVSSDLSPWAPGGHRLLVRLVPDMVSGRRIELRSVAVDRRGYL